MKKAIFLDRDGVINKTVIRNGLHDAPFTLDELKVLPYVKESILILKELNFLCVVVTNQPNVSRGKVTKSSVLEINNHLKIETKFDDIFVCYHDDIDNCNCRKPKAGLLIEASKKLDINLKKSFMVGDRWRDIGAGNNAGCKTIFIDYKYNEIKPDNPDFTTDSLINAAAIIKKINV